MGGRSQTPGRAREHRAQTPALANTGAANTGASGEHRDFAAWVRALRAYTGDTQVAFAARVGCSEHAVIGWECWGRRPYPALARALDAVAREVGFPAYTDTHNAGSIPAR